MESSSPTHTASSWLHERPAIAVTILIACGIALCNLLPVHPMLWLAGAAVALGLAVAARGAIASAFVALALVLIGLTAAQIERYQFRPSHISAYTNDSERFAQIDVELNQSPRLIAPPAGELRDLPPKQIAEAAVRAIRTETGWQDASGQILLSIEQPNPRLNAGQIVRLTGILQRPLVPMNPGEFDFAAYCRDRRILAEMRVAHADGIQILKDPGPSLPTWLREKTRHLLAQGFPLDRGYDHALLRAFVLGDPDPQLQDLLDEFVRTGTVHLFSTSGLHVAIVGGLVLFVCRLLRCSPRRSTTIVLAAVVLYAAVATPSWPGWRSVLMGAAAMIGILGRRTAHAVQLFFVAIATILLIHPTDLFDGGFQVSFAAVLGMILFCTPATHGFWSWWRGPDAIALGPPRHGPISAAVRWTTQFFVSALIAGLVAWLLAMPLVAYHFGQLNWWSVPAGVALLPLTVVAMLAGLGKILLTLCWPGLSAIWAAASAAPVLWLGHVVHLLDKLPGASMGVAPPLWFLIAYYAAMTVLLLRPRKSAMRVASWIAPLVVCVAFVLWPAATASAARPELQVTLLSLGAGQCGIIRLPSGHVVFIDTGSSTVSDLTRRLIGPYLKQQHCSQVDQIILSHGDFDHISSAADLFIQYHTDISMSPHFARNAVGNLPAEALLQTLDDAARPPHILARGDHLQLDKDVGLDVLWPPVNCDMNSNNCGLVLRLRYAGRSVLFPADIQSPPEAALLKSPADLKSDALVAPHHGSAESTTPAFLRAVNPEVILASNDRKLTHKQRLFDTEAQSWPVYRTHRCGAVTLSIDASGRMEVSTWLGVGPRGPPAPSPSATTQKSSTQPVSN